MTKRKSAAVVPLILVSGIVAWWLLGQGEADDPGLQASGTVEATESDLGFQLTGRIERVEPREGDRVEVGRVLALLDRREWEADLASLEAGVEQSRARLAELERGARPRELARAEAAVRSAREVLDDRMRDAERARRLHDGGAISLEAMQKTETAATLARAALDEARESLELLREGPRSEQIEAQRAQLRQTEARLARARLRIENAEIAAPFDGVVAVRHREPGETAGAGAPVLTLRNLADRWVRIYVAGDQVGRVRLGQSAEIRSDTHPDRRYSGEVAFIGSEAEFTPRNVQTTEERIRLVYPVRVRITGDPEVDLKPGIPVDVVLLEEEQPTRGSQEPEDDERTARSPESEGPEPVAVHPVGERDQ